MRCSASVMVVSGNWPMLSAEMLSWMSGARRFSSIARICEARTPTTVTVCNSGVAVLVAGPFDLAFLALGDGVVEASCGVGPCGPALGAGVPAPGDAMADVAMAASNAMDTAIDTGCL